MPTDLVKRLDLDLIYPGLLVPLLDTLSACKVRGTNYVAISGYRSFVDQGRLYFQGRTTPGKIVTNAQAGYSAHNYGIAVDCVRNASLAVRQLTPDWDPAHYDLLGEEGRKRGLQVGVPSVSGGDKGHIQLPLIERLGRPEVEALREMKAAYDAGGLKAAWALLDSWGFDKSAQPST